MNPNPYEIFRSRMKERRTILNITLTEIAEALDITQPTVQRYESGEIKNIPYDKLVMLADLLQCTPPYLLGWGLKRILLRKFREKKNACSIISGN